jgi:hypothetical protein
MGLLRGVARTAVVAGTATAVSNNVSRRQQARWEARQPEQYAQPQHAQPQYAPPPSPPPAADDVSVQLDRLVELHRSGVLTDEEFTASKARVLGL